MPVSTVEPQHGENEVTSGTFDLICWFFFSYTESYCWNVTGAGSICSRYRAECWGKLVLRLVLTGLPPTIGSAGTEGNENAVAWLPAGPFVPAAPGALRCRSQLFTSALFIAIPNLPSSAH